MPEEKTITPDPIETFIPPQEQLFFPTVDPANEAEVHYSKLRQGIGVKEISQETVIPETSDDDRQVHDLVRFLRHLATADETEQRELLEKMKGQDDIQLLQLSNETTHGLDIDAQVYQSDAQKKAEERQSQVAMATEVAASPNRWSNLFSRFRKTAA